MPKFTIGFPCKTVTRQVVNPFFSVSTAAFKEDAEIIIGIQDIEDSDPQVISFLLEQPKTRIVHTCPATNLSATLNHIILESAGRYFVRTDDDDYMHPLRITRLREIIDDGIDFAIIGQSYKCFSEYELGSLITPSLRSVDNKLRLLLGVPFAHPAITLDLLKIGESPYDELQIYAQDYMLYVDMIAKGKYVGVANLATYYRLPVFGSEMQRKRREKQLDDHEKAMKKIWNATLYENLTDEEVHLLRCNLVTNEFSKINYKGYYGWCRSKLGEASKILLKHLSDE